MVLTSDDLSFMEKLMADLDETKRSSWNQIALRSEQFYEERKMSFANKYENIESHTGTLLGLKTETLIKKSNLHYSRGNE